jgi:hypothetical protein
MKINQLIMKKTLIFLVPVCIVLLFGCKNPVIYSQYEVILPEIPPDWESVLGDPFWRIEWVDQEGNWQKIDTAQNETLRKSEAVRKSRNFHLEICNTKINPVIAYPYWPEKNLFAGQFYPAGAIFPLDAQNGAIKLDWRGGIDAQLYLYLSGFNNEGTRSPEQFDWQRFRSLLRTEIEDADIKADPWLVDWEAAAARIAASGFRNSYISLRKYEDISVTIPESGLWISPSPFEQGKNWNAGEIAVLKAAESPSRYVSAKGTIVFTHKTSAFFPEKD